MIGIRRAIVTLALALAVSPASAVISGGDVGAEISKMPGAASLGVATVAYYAVDITTGQILAEHRSSAPMIPASNLKVITSGTALLIFGPDFSFSTEMKFDGERLTIIGDGDPAFADPELLTEMQMDIEKLLATWVDDIEAAGITEIKELVIDDRIFDMNRVHPSWPKNQLERPYCAQVAGFNFFGNCLALYVRPSAREGVAPNTDVEPDVSSWLDLTNRAKSTRRRGAQNSIYVMRRQGSNRFTLSGEIRVPQQAPIYVTVDDPAEFFARIFADRLRARNITVGSYRSAERTDGAPAGEIVGRPIRTPIDTILRRCNRDSENLYAESLLKRMGYELTAQPGSWINGAAVVRMVLSKHLSPALATTLEMHDGSGLSRGNRVTAKLLGSWLAFMHEVDAARQPFLDSFAVAGESGTLRRRFTTNQLANRVLGKSGYINGVSCLSGYLIAEDGHTIAYSVLVNNIPTNVPVRRAKELQEQIVLALDGYLSEVAPPARTPVGETFATPLDR